MSFEKWASSYLNQLGLSDAEDVVSYLLTIDDAVVVEEYLTLMLDPSNVAHKTFITDFIEKLIDFRSPHTPGFYKKPNFEIEQNWPKGRKSKEAEKSVSPSSTTSSGKKKTKFVSLYSAEGESRTVILIPGRHKCDCQALKHRLINNCLKCGRIICEQEGSGPCSFCGNLVASKEEREILNRGSKKSETLHNILVNTKKITSEKKSNNCGLQKAIEHKNKLLEYDITSEKRTKVFDDQSDYFHSNSKWINPANREKLQKIENELKQKKYDRNNKKLTIDFLGRKVIAEEDSIIDLNDSIINELIEGDESGMYSYGENTDATSQLSIVRPIFIGSNDSVSKKTNKSISKSFHRLQDKLIQEMSDEGMCLSMHQPWASLLVMGIKKHEGRVWYSSHRGRLWISSGSKVPLDSEIHQVEQMYRNILKSESIKFPRHYPAGCLIGCVDVSDVLPQEEYCTVYPGGESENPYVFICENPQEMVVKFPIKGQHKIYKLDSKIHKAAKKSLREVA